MGNPSEVKNQTPSQTILLSLELTRLWEVSDVGGIPNHVKNKPKDLYGMYCDN